MTYACRTCDTTFTAPTDTDTVRCPGCGDMVEQQPAESSPPPDQTAVERSERYATAIHDAMETDLSLVDQEPGMQALFARAAEAAMALADAEQTVPPLAEDVTVSVSEKRARLFGFIEVGAEESDLPSFAAAIDDYVNAVTAPIERIRENADFHLGQEMARRQLAEKEADRLSADRGAVLNAAADAVFALNYDDLVSEQDDENLGSMREAWDLGTIHATQLLRRLAAEAQQQESGSGCAHCVCCHTWGDREAHAALVRDDGAEAQQQPATCRNCRGSGLDPRYNGEYACPDCPAEAPQPEEEAELVCVDQCGNCDACGMEPFGTPAEGWREAARFLRRTPRDSTDFSGALRGARLIEDELRRRAEAQQPDTETRTSWTPGPVALARAAEWATKRQDATVDPAMCPRCKGDNREAFALCPACAQAAAAGPGRAADTHHDEAQGAEQ